MSGKDDDVDRESYYRDAAETWARGCRGEPLSDKESRRFHGFARDRFYTFLMSANHARTEGDGEKLSSLIRSLAKDLVGSPGLEAKWHESEFSEDEFGQMVSAMLETLRGAPESHACDDE